MSATRITTRFSRITLAWYRNSPLLFCSGDRKYVSTFSDRLICFHGQVELRHQSMLHFSAMKSYQWLRFSSSSSPQVTEETAQSGIGLENKTDTEAITSANDGSDHSEAPVSDGKAESGVPVESVSEISETSKRRRKHTKRIAFSDSDSDSDLEPDLSRDDLVKLLTEKEHLLFSKQEELDKMKDKVLMTFADMENVKDRTRRESENAKKFAIQNFAKSLLDVADNMGRASFAAKESFSKIDASSDTSGAVQQLKILLEGVEMTEKQLSEVFKKFGLEKYNPTDEEFDPNRHNAVFQVPSFSKPVNHVAVVLKAGYMLHDRVIRPAEVGVTVAINEEAEVGSQP
ncbi:grpE protein homolog 2, mitochondrial-like [Primulina huaijiensis]|uniref:grpE protein homolog 2, mitochondrial-like n=1 Tax=Primulina huaijiensis TaxID=1492673 RepID=UPI003CC766BA